VIFLSREDTVALFGAGSIGSIEAKAWRKALGEGGTLIIVDSNPAKRELAESLGAEFACMNAAAPESAGALKELAARAGTWSISTNTDTHAFLLDAALENGVRKVFLEKPSAEKPNATGRTLSRHPGALVQVDYVECGHPAVLAAVADMKDEGFVPAEFFNWRGKDLRNATNRGIGGGLGSRITLEDLVHDISEIDFVLRETRGTSLADAGPEITQAQITSWAELDREKYPFSSDASAQFSLSTGNGARAEVRGGFNEPERRYFIVASEGRERAYFVNTLARPHIQPAAFKVEGRENVDKLFERARAGAILGDLGIDSLVRETRASRLDLSHYSGLSPIERMVCNLREAESEGGLICPAGRAVAIEKVAEAVYARAGRTDAMEFRDLSLMAPPEPVAGRKLNKVG
jgi:predicted dehydrogenase